MAGERHLRLGAVLEHAHLDDGQEGTARRLSPPDSLLDLLSHLVRQVCVVTGCVSDPTVFWGHGRILTAFTVHRRR